MKASASYFRCLGRSTKPGALLLPEEIISAGQPLLAGPVRLVSDPDLLGNVKGTPRVIKRTDDQAVWEWAGESAAVRPVARMTGDCDGFFWYEIVLTPTKPVELNSLRLEMPRLAATAKYLRTANFTWGNFSGGLPEHGGQWSHAFMPYIWLGDEERGLAWCAESDRGWSLKDPAQALAIQTMGGRSLVPRHLARS